MILLADVLKQSEYAHYLNLRCDIENHSALNEQGLITGIGLSPSHVNWWQDNRMWLLDIAQFAAWILIPPPAGLAMAAIIGLTKAAEYAQHEQWYEMGWEILWAVMPYGSAAAESSVIAKNLKTYFQGLNKTNQAKRFAKLSDFEKNAVKWLVKQSGSSKMRQLVIDEMYRRLVAGVASGRGARNLVKETMETTGKGFFEKFPALRNAWGRFMNRFYNRKLTAWIRVTDWWNHGYLGKIAFQTAFFVGAEKTYTFIYRTIQQAMLPINDEQAKKMSQETMVYLLPTLMESCPNCDPDQLQEMMEQTNWEDPETWADLYSKNGGNPAGLFSNIAFDGKGRKAIKKEQRTRPRFKGYDQFVATSGGGTVNVDKNRMNTIYNKIKTEFESARSEQERFLEFCKLMYVSLKDRTGGISNDDITNKSANFGALNKSGQLHLGTPREFTKALYNSGGLSKFIKYSDASQSNMLTKVNLNTEKYYKWVESTAIQLSGNSSIVSDRDWSSYIDGPYNKFGMRIYPNPILVGETQQRNHSGTSLDKGEYYPPADVITCCKRLHYYMKGVGTKTSLLLQTIRNMGEYPQFGYRVMMYWNSHSEFNEGDSLYDWLEGESNIFDDFDYMIKWLKGKLSGVQLDPTPTSQLYKDAARVIDAQSVKDLEFDRQTRTKFLGSGPPASWDPPVRFDPAEMDRRRAEYLQSKNK